MSEFSGGCLCGRVRYTAGKPTVCGHCHCVDCRKTSATGHATHAMVAGPSFEVTGELACYERPADSGNLVTRYFCPDCGSRVWHGDPAWEAEVSVKGGSLDRPVDLSQAVHIWTCRKLPGVVIPDGAPRHEREPQ